MQQEQFTEISAEVSSEPQAETAAEREKRIMDSVRQTQISTALTLKSIDNTLASVDQTLKGVAQTQQRLEDFSNGFNTTMTNMASKFFQGMDEPESYIPEISDIETVTKGLIRSSNVIIALGQESSSVDNLQFQIQELKGCLNTNICLDAYHEYRCGGNKEEFWDHFHNLKHQINDLPLELNKNLARALLRVNTDGQIMIIVSDVGDGLMKKSFGTFQSFQQQSFGGGPAATQSDNENLVMEFNGNINTLICEIPDCTQGEYTCASSLQEIDPSCPSCGAEGVYVCNAKARPSVLYPKCSTHIETLFSQAYEHTCLVLLGSTFTSPVLQQLVQTAIENGSLVVEISEVPTIEVGRVKQLIGDPQTIGPVLCENIIENFY